MSDSQFRRTARYPGNLDRCRWCGYPRMLHGGDGSCRLTLSRAGGLAAVLVVAGGMLGGAVWLLVSDPVITRGSLLAFICLVALVLLVTGTAFAARRN